MKADFSRGGGTWKEESNGGKAYNGERLQKQRCNLFPQASEMNLYHLLSLFTLKPKITSFDKLYKSKCAGSGAGGGKWQKGTF